MGCEDNKKKNYIHYYIIQANAVYGRVALVFGAHARWTKKSHSIQGDLHLLISDPLKFKRDQWCQVTK